MPHILLPDRWKKQPQDSADIDWTNPLSKNLIVAFNFALGAINLVNGEKWTESDLVRSATPMDIGVKAKSSSSGNIVGPAKNYARLPGLPSDILSVCWGMSGVQLADWRQMWGWDNSQADADLIQLTAAGKIECKLGGGLAANTATGVLTSGETCHLAIRYKSTGGGDLIKNGRSALISTATASYPKNASTQPHILGSSAITRHLTTPMPYWYIFGRVLSDAELVAIVENPWQIFKRRRKVLYFNVSSGLPTLSASTYKPGTLTSTGWTPRITAS